MFVDTQIVSYAMKGRGPAIPNWLCCSIMANEFLLVQSESATKARYYIPLPSIQNHLHGDEGASRASIPSARYRRQHPFPKRVTDSMVMEFGLLHSPLVEFGNFAIAELLNEKIAPMFSAAVSFLSKNEQRLLVDRFKFLLSSGIHCVPLQRQDVETAFSLLEIFLRHRNPKSNFRNTWNDLLILAVAMNRGSRLLTSDLELAAFAHECDAGTVTRDGAIAAIDCTLSMAAAPRRESRGAKGYVNSSWRVHVRNIGNRRF